MSGPAAIARDVSRKYSLYSRPSDRLMELLLRQSRHRDFWALRDVNFSVPRGQTLGIVGENGSGKSTLLQLLAGVLHPTTGEIMVRGRVAALLELGAGFNPEFTGRENVILSGAIMGVSEAEMRSRIDDIAAFAEIGDFLDEPVKTYSSGMYVRLAFATAINVDPEVLIIDEALAVGDAYFQHRCMLRMAEIQARGVTIIVVSHDAAAIKRLCQRVLWLEKGRIVEDGEPEPVTNRYLSSLFRHAERAVLPPPDRSARTALKAPHVDRRFGNGGAEVVGIGLFGAQDTPITRQVHGRPFEIRLQVVFHRAMEKPIVGFILRDRLGTDLASTNTTMEGCELPAAQAGTTYLVTFTCEPPRLHPGNYAITPTVADGDLTEYAMEDWIDNAISLEITGEVLMHTLMRFPVRCGLEIS